METKTRRHFLGYLALPLGAMAASGLLWMRQRSEPQRPYQIMDSRPLPIGGLGLFIAVERGLPQEPLEALGERLRQEYRGQSNMVVSVFDDAEAARTVRRGSRLVGEEAFQAALAHQVAFYVKDSRTGRHAFTIYGEPQVVVQYAGA